MAADTGKPHGRTPYEPLWGARVRRLIEQALGEVTDGIDAIGTLESAITMLRIEAGEVSASEMDGYPFPDEPEDESGCTCPPELLERGGFRGGCPVHSSLHR